VIVDSLTVLDDGLVDALDAAGIDRAIVCPPRARGHGYDVENDRVAAAVREAQGGHLGDDLALLALRVRDA
jgi:hypothetical protein